MKDSIIIKMSIEKLMEYKNLAEIIPIDIVKEKWIEKLSKKEKKFFLGEEAPLNLLKLGYHLAIKSIHVIEQYSSLLYNLDKYLGIIVNAEYEIKNNYAEKLINIEGRHIFSALSELALAYHFTMKGYSLSYFHKYRLIYDNGTTKEKDIDLKIQLDEKCRLIEVYMPTYIPEFEDGYSDNPLIEIENIKRQLYSKIDKKFDLKNNPKISGINDNIYMAVNIKYDTMLLSQISPPIGFNKKADDYFRRIYNLFINSLKDLVLESRIVAGVILFETDFFARDNSIVLFNSFGKESK